MIIGFVSEVSPRTADPACSGISRDPTNLKPAAGTMATCEGSSAPSWGS